MPGSRIITKEIHLFLGAVGLGLSMDMQMWDIKHVSLDWTATDGDGACGWEESETGAGIAQTDHHSETHFIA